MKYTLLIYTLFLASALSYAGTLQVSSSNVDLDTKGAINRNLGIDTGFDTDNGLTLEYGFDNGWSFQYGTVDATGSASAILSTEDAALANDLLGVAITQAGDKLSLTENYEATVLMLKYNTGADLSEKLFYNATFGAGFTKVKVGVTGSFNNESASLTDSDRSFTFSLGLGLGYRLTESTSLILNYELRSAKDGEFKDLGLKDADFDHTSIDIGVKMNF